MRIDPFNSAASQVSTDLSSQQVTPRNTAQAGLSSDDDRATLTSTSTSVGSLVSTALASPEVRQHLVESLRQSVSSGQYVLDPSQIASSILNEHA